MLDKGFYFIFRQPPSIVRMLPDGNEKYVNMQIKGWYQSWYAVLYNQYIKIAIRSYNFTDTLILDKNLNQIPDSILNFEG